MFPVVIMCCIKCGCCKVLVEICKPKQKVTVIQNTRDPLDRAVIFSGGGRSESGNEDPIGTAPRIEPTPILSFSAQPRRAASYMQMNAALNYKNVDDYSKNADNNFAQIGSLSRFVQGLNHRDTLEPDTTAPMLEEINSPSIQTLPHHYESMDKEQVNNLLKDITQAGLEAQVTLRRQSMRRHKTDSSRPRSRSRSRTARDGGRKADLQMDPVQTSTL